MDEKRMEERIRMWQRVFTTLWLGILAGIDARCKYVPVWLLAVIGVIVTVVSEYGNWKGSLRVAELLWSVFPGIVLVMVAVFTKMAGWADGVVLMMLGIQAGFRTSAISFALGLVCISVVSLVLLTLRKVNKNTKLPFLPFLYVGYLVQAAFRITA